MFYTFSGNVARAKTQQGHTFDTEGGDHNLAGFPIGYRLVVVANNLDDNEFRMNMTAHTILAFREGCRHLGRGVGGKEFHFGPFLGYAFAQQVEFEVLVAQSFADTDDAADTAGVIVNTMSFSVFDKA